MTTPTQPTVHNAARELARLRWEWAASQQWELVSDDYSYGTVAHWADRAAHEADIREYLEEAAMNAYAAAWGEESDGRVDQTTAGD